MMQASISMEDDRPDPPPVLTEALLEEMERITEPALLYLSGGRIAAINKAANRLSDLPVVGMRIHDLLARYEARRADGSLLIRSDLPYARALRGEVVALGERIEMNLPDGRIYRALVTSTPVIVNGEVVAALSIWYDFDAYIRELTSSTKVPDDPERDGFGGRRTPGYPGVH